VEIASNTEETLKEYRRNTERGSNTEETPMNTEEIPTKHRHPEENTNESAKLLSAISIV
jgi:hypothetical protein